MFESARLLSRCFSSSLVLLGLLCAEAHAGSTQIVASDKVYAKNERWFIVTDGAGNACSLAVNFSSVEVLMLGVENKNGQLLSTLSYVRKNLNLSMQGNYRVKVTFENGDFYVRKARAIEVDDASGIIVDGMKPDFIAEFSRNKTINLKVGDVSYGTYDLTRSNDGVAKLFDCMRDTTKWDITASMPLRH